MNELVCFLLGMVTAAAAALIVFVPVVEFYKNQYVIAAELLQKIKDEIDKKMEEEV